jgi:hypothetical protein
MLESYKQKIEFALGLISDKNYKKNEDWLAYKAFILENLKCIKEKPIEDVYDKKSVIGVVLFEHYRIERNKSDNTLKLSINFNKNPLGTDFTEINLQDEIEFSTQSIKEQIDNGVDESVLRQPNLRWLFDLKLKINDVGVYGAFSSKEQFSPHTTNYFALALYIKTAAYFGVLDYLDNEVIYHLSKSTKDFCAVESLKSKPKSEIKIKLFELLYLAKVTLCADEQVNGYWKNHFFTAQDMELQIETARIDDKIQAKLIGLCRERIVLAYLKKTLNYCFLTDYMQVIENLKPYQADVKRIKKESNALFHYILAFENNLACLKDTNHFSFDAKVSDWDCFKDNHTFPQPLALKNFKKILVRNIELKTTLFEYSEAYLNYELLHGLKITSEQKKHIINIFGNNIKTKEIADQRIKNNWVVLMCWLTYGQEWQDYSENEFFSLMELFESINHLNFNGLYVELGLFIDLFIQTIRENKRIKKEQYALNKTLCDEGKISKKERTERNESNEYRGQKEISELTDFIMGDMGGIYCVEGSNLNHIESKTTIKSLRRKVENWHNGINEQNSSIKEQLATKEPFGHLVNATFDIDGASFELLISDYQIYKEGAKMKHCVYTYSSNVGDFKYLVFKGILEGESFTLGLSINFQTHKSINNISFKLGQCVGYKNKDVSANIKKSVAKLIDNLNENPYLVLNSEQVRAYMENFYAC